MSRLFLLRHAQAGPATPDSQRPLSDLGRLQAQAVGGVLAKIRPHGPSPRCSPARRCRETATLLGIGEPQVDERLALDRPVHELLDLARSCPADGLLVGHQPELQALLAALLPGGAGQPFALPPASLVGLARSGGSAILTLYLEPGDVGRMDAARSEE